jgi:oligosaccharide repeat unit polymerase
MKNNPFKLITIFLIGFILIIFFRPPELSNEENASYNIITTLYIVMSVYGFIIFKRKDLFVFEPIVVIYAMYMGIFVYQPIIDIIHKSYYLVGINILPGCFMGSLIVGISFGFLLLGYYQPVHSTSGFYKLSNNNHINRNTALHRNTKNLLRTAYIIWGVSWLIYSISWVSARGASLSYLLTMGMDGEVNQAQRAQTPLGFLFNFGSCMIASYMYIFIYEKRAILKIITFALTFLAYMFAGYRFIIIQLTSTIIIYIYAKKMKNPKATLVGILAFIALLFASIVEFIRGGLRTGTGVNTEGYNFSDNILSPFESNFTLYKVFYRFTEIFPEHHPFTWGNTMIWETIYFIIPRAIWPEKPKTELFDRMSEAFGPQILTTGTALNNISEYYYEFGIIGCIFFMYLFGYIFGRSRKLFLKKNANDHDLIFFSMLFSIAFSCVNAGYMPMNFYMIVMTLIPVLFMKKKYRI